MSERERTHPGRWRSVLEEFSEIKGITCVDGDDALNQPGVEESQRQPIASMGSSESRLWLPPPPGYRGRTRYE
eukprot:1348143-Amorphochlora_amoeboformis.AAC.1